MCLSLSVSVWSLCNANVLVCAGDLGRIDPVTGCLFITGRAKDTIVLMNGENVEPEPLEEALIESPLISQAMLVGQDAKALSGVIVLDVHGCAAGSCGLILLLVPGCKDAVLLHCYCSAPTVFAVKVRRSPPFSFHPWKLPFSFTVFSAQ